MKRILLPLVGMAAAFVAAQSALSAPLIPDENSARLVTISTRGAPLPVHQRITLGLGKAAVVELDTDARDVVVSNPEIADAVVRTPRRIFLMGQKGGQTNAFFFDLQGKQIASIDIRVEKDTTDLGKIIKLAFPDTDIKAQAINDTVILTGHVVSAAEAQRVTDIAASFAGDPKKVVNVLTIRSSEQVMLKVRVAEMQRTVAKQFGIDLTSAMSVAGVPMNFGTSNQFGLVGHALNDLSGGQAGSVCAAHFYPQSSSTTNTTLTNGNTTNASTTIANGNSTSLTNNSAAGVTTTTTVPSATGTVQYVVQNVNGVPVVTGVIPSTAGGAGDLSSIFTGTVGAAATAAQTASNLANSVQNLINGSNTVQTITSTDPCASPNNLQGTVKALEQVGLVHILAEPNLTAVSGETAKFLAGGEFPVPVARDRDGNVTLQFKQFGVGLSFTPVVLGPGRISLQISTEVSELTNTGAYTLQGSTSSNTITIPALSVRRAETTVEVPSGGSFSIAGLMQHTTKQVLDGFPGAKDLPILGALFRSRDFSNEETELVVLVTAYLVKPTTEAKLAAPTDGFVVPTDLETILLGRLNAIYGHDKDAKDGAAKAAEAPGGYIVQ